MLKVVVLPAPFGPSSPTISPGPTRIVTPLTTRRWRYSLTRFSVASRESPRALAVGAAAKTFDLKGSVWGSVMSSHPVRVDSDLAKNSIFARSYDFVVGAVEDKHIVSHRAIGRLQKGTAGQFEHFIRRRGRAASIDSF